MFNDVGLIIKFLACITFVLIIVLCFTYSGAFLGGIWGRIAMAFFGAVVSVSLYGFGELINKVSDIELKIKGEHIKSKAQLKAEFKRIDMLEKLRSWEIITEEEYLQAVSKEYIAPSIEENDEEKTSPEEALEILKDKLDLGEITEEEYTAQRAEIIKNL